MSIDVNYPHPLLGIDEVGAGSLAGPLTACGVVLPQDPQVRNALVAAGARDSKKMTEGSRQRVVQECVRLGIWANVVDMDPWRVLNGEMFTAFSRMFDQIVREARSAFNLKTVLVDGRHRPCMHFRHTAVVGGDNESLSIAVASIFAKEHRDALMRTLDEEYPLYGFSRHKGYGTPEHLKAIEDYGVTKWHRDWCKPVAKIRKRQSPSGE